jgi:hypothetical protein
VDSRVDCRADRGAESSMQSGEERSMQSGEVGTLAGCTKLSNFPTHCPPEMVRRGWRAALRSVLKEKAANIVVKDRSGPKIDIFRFRQRAGG